VTRYLLLTDIQSLKTDHGRQLTSQEFEAYLDEHGIEHRTSPPLWPQANGEIERQNRIMLKAMRISATQGKDWKSELYKFLIAYRSTPHEITGFAEKSSLNCQNFVNQ